MNPKTNRLEFPSKRIVFSTIYWGIFWASVWANFILILSIITGAWAAYDMAEPVITYAILGGFFGVIGGISVGRRAKGFKRSALSWMVVFAVPGAGLAVYTSMILLLIIPLFFGAAGGGVGELVYYRVRSFRFYRQLLILTLVVVVPLLLLVHSPYYLGNRDIYFVYNDRVIENP
ncbi:MAG: hypothetical protein JXA42_23545, partial [Anaerolineales bacterium]|nr:hypothetical protein [Anaerolineales bacterium]